MKIAIIGAGAAGMTTAYLLNKQHEITVFEKQPILGGNIRTLNKNVTGVALDSELVLDCGVLEFQTAHFPNFHKLMKQLNVTMAQGKTSSELFLANGHYYKSGAGLMHHCKNVSEFFSEAAKLLPVLKGYLLFLFAAFRATPEELYDQPVSAYLNREIHAVWLKMLLMYAYSMPYQKIADFPAEIAIPLLRHSSMFTQWDRVVGGVYTYIEKILEQFDGTIHCNANLKSVFRTATGVVITMADADKLAFDKVVFAVTPEQVLKLLGDASADEQRRFGGWQENELETVIHTDVSFYKHFGVSYYSEFDVFQKDRQGHCGYNAYLNRLYAIDPAKYPHYSLAYNLDKQINPAKIIHRQQHHTPLYSVTALRYRREVTATNGENHTYHAGAYLGEGLHEGAISSAFAVTDLFNGDKGLASAT
jgi:predicted NAD/FAD-binding protein